MYFYERTCGKPGKLSWKPLSHIAQLSVASDHSPTVATPSTNTGRSSTQPNAATEAAAEGTDAVVCTTTNPAKRRTFAASQAFSLETDKMKLPIGKGRRQEDDGLTSL